MRTEAAVYLKIDAILQLRPVISMVANTVKIDDLDKEAEHLLEEARMVLPGIQALFGFQLIAFFNQRFTDGLSAADQCIHLGALLLAALSIGFVMAPAAYHRQAEPGQVSRAFVKIATRLITIGMLPLLIALTLDTYVVAKLVFHDARGIYPAVGLFSVLAVLWYAWPQWRRTRRLPTKIT
jgi:hypothetical protein